MGLQSPRPSSCKAQRTEVEELCWSPPLRDCLCNFYRYTVTLFEQLCPFWLSKCQLQTSCKAQWRCGFACNSEAGWSTPKLVEILSCDAKH
eukprot:2251648-Amphidinium_carterae.1